MDLCHALRWHCPYSAASPVTVMGFSWTLNLLKYTCYWITVTADHWSVKPLRVKETFVLIFFTFFEHEVKNKTSVLRELLWWFWHRSSCQTCYSVIQMEFFVTPKGGAYLGLVTLFWKLHNKTGNKRQVVQTERILDHERGNDNAMNKVGLSLWFVKKLIFQSHVGLRHSKLPFVLSNKGYLEGFS